MTLSDRRLLIELGAVLIIKLLIIFLLKSYFFNSENENSHTPIQQHFFPQPAFNQNDKHAPQQNPTTNEER